MATKGSVDKRRDAAPMGLWVLAGSWSGRNNQAGWVPCEELDRFDDDWEMLAKRLVVAGFWWPEERDGEDGYGFNDWGEWNNPTGPSASGTFGNHTRWHVNKGVVKDDCEHCPKEPDGLEDEPEHRPDSGATRPDDRPDVAPTSPPMSESDRPESGGESLRDHRPDSLTRPDPTRPDQKSIRASADAERMSTEFDEWYAAYPRKKGKGQAVKAYRAARKKTTHPVLLAAVVKQSPTLTKDGMDYAPYPATWLNGERWEDDDTPQASVHHLPHARDIVQPPDGLTDQEYYEWYVKHHGGGA